MSYTTLFRFVLIAGLFFSITAGVAGITLSDTLPETLQRYLNQQDDAELTGVGLTFLLFTTLLVIILSVVITVGLWKFKSWARTLYVVIIIALIPFYPFLGPVVMNGWEAMFHYITVTLSGILLAMMFIGDVSHKFKSSKVPESSE